PEVSLVDEDASAALRYEPRSPRLGNPRRIQATESKQSQDVGVRKGEEVDVRAYVVKRQVVLPKPRSKSDVLAVPKLRSSDSLTSKHRRARCSFDDELGAARRRARDDAKAAVRTDVGDQRGARSDVAHVQRSSQERLHRRWACIEDFGVDWRGR